MVFRRAFSILQTQAFCSGASLHWKYWPIYCGIWLVELIFPSLSFGGAINWQHWRLIRYSGGAVLFTFTPFISLTFCGGVSIYSWCKHCSCLNPNLLSGVNTINWPSLIISKIRLFVQWAVARWILWTQCSATSFVVFCGGTFRQHRRTRCFPIDQFGQFASAIHSIFSFIYKFFRLITGLIYTLVWIFFSAGPTRQGGIPGPNSGHSKLARLLIPIFYLGLWSSTIMLTTWSEGEGQALSMESLETPDSWINALSNSMGVKQHGQLPELGSGQLFWTPEDSSVKKRSIRRAYKRAITTGCAWYKGRCWTPADFPNSLKGSIAKPTQVQSPSKEVKRYNQSQQTGRRLKLLTWNCAGLSSSKLDEIRLRMEHQLL